MAKTIIKPNDKQETERVKANQFNDGGGNNLQTRLPF